MRRGREGSLEDLMMIVRIRGAVAEDEGRYECQVSTETKLSSVFHLKVVTPQVSQTELRH